MHDGQAMRVYFCKWLGLGTDESPYHVSIYDHVERQSIAGLCDIRRDASLSNGYAVAWGDTTDAEHSSIISDANCAYISPAGPLPDGIPLCANDVGDISMFVELLGRRGVDVSSLSPSSSVMNVLQLAFPGMQ
jgi:hypothetical protein